MDTLQISVVLPTHNPDRSRLDRTLEGLRAQTLPSGLWETVVVDNATAVPLREAGLARPGLGQLRLIREEQLGLSRARRTGFEQARAAVFVLVDDDNVLAPDYLAHVAELFRAHPRIGALGGRSLPEFEREPEEWKREFLPLLALRDLGEEPRISQGLRPPGAAADEYPVDSAPIGAGMAIRREAARQWMADLEAAGLPDRRGRELSSAGDNDIVLSAMRQGWEVGYFPQLRLTHLIPAARLDPAYLARLNRGIQKSWLQVLVRRGVSPWPAIPRWSVPLRQAKAWFAWRAWSGPAAYIRWQGVCGHFEGRSR